MPRAASTRSRRAAGFRASTPAVVLGSLLVSLGLTAAGGPQAQAQQTLPRKHSRLVPVPDATELRVLDWALWNISKYYVEPQRIDPAKMTLAGLEALENSIAEVLVQPVDKDGRVKVHVGTHERDFGVEDIEALWAVGPRIREVFQFVDESTSLSEEEQRQAEYALVAGVLSTLDPHTNLLRPDDFEDMRASTKGSFGGLGIEVGMRDGAITVIRVIEGNPASTVDMQPGDRIVQIDAESTVTMNLNEAVGRLRGPPGSSVAVYVLRDGLEKPKRLEITRATIKLDSVIGDVLIDKDASGATRKVGLVQIPRNFAQTTGRELRAKLQEFEEAGVEGVILDLRNNPGGLLTAAVEVADAFLSAGTIVSTVGTSAPEEVSRATDRDDFPEHPLVVLVDEGSASASEIVAGALRNLGRAVLLGRRTFGKGSVQVLHERKVGDKELALKLTIAQYLTPGDVSIQSVGVSPDLETVPVWLGKDHIAYFGRNRFDLLREEALAAHLESATAKAQDVPFGPLYFLDRAAMEEGEEDEEGGDASKPAPSGKDARDAAGDKRSSMLLEDPEVRIARDLVLWAPSPDRSTNLGRMKEFVSEQERLAQKELADALAERGIDWSPGPAPAAGTAASLKATVRSDQPNNTIRGGETGKVTVSVTNVGTAPAYQVRAITDSDYRYFDERELIFGRIEPGETKSRDIKLSVSEHELSRTDRIDVHLFEQYGAKLAPDSESSIDVAAAGLPRPQFSYGYQIIDDPAFGEHIEGNADGLLQVGERVSLRVDVVNEGEGPALDPWVTLRNLSGEDVFLHTGREHLEEIQPGETGVAHLDVELKHAPQGGEAKLQLTVSDNKIAEVLSDKVAIPIETAGPGFEKLSRGVTASSAVELLASPREGSPSVARVEAGVPVRATGKVGDWLRIDLGKQRYAFAPERIFTPASGKPSTKAPATEAAYAVSPPRISMPAVGNMTAAESVPLSGVATDDEAVQDLYIVVRNPSRDLFGNGEKVYYTASRNPADGRLEFSADVPLTPGNNFIEVHARENEDVVAIHRMWVLRTSGLAEARAESTTFESPGTLSVDTLK